MVTTNIFPNVENYGHHCNHLLFICKTHYTPALALISTGSPCTTAGFFLRIL